MENNTIPLDENVNILILGTNSELKDVIAYMLDNQEGYIAVEQINYEPQEVLRKVRRSINIHIFPKHRTKIFILRLKQDVSENLTFQVVNTVKSR